ncbi:hypothetical protein [Motilimonas sp. KMU-193]
MNKKPISEEELALWIEQVHNSSCCSDIVPDRESAEPETKDDQSN